MERVLFFYPAAIQDSASVASHTCTLFLLSTFISREGAKNNTKATKKTLRLCDFFAALRETYMLMLLFKIYFIKFLPGFINAFFNQVTATMDVNMKIPVEL